MTIQEQADAILARGRWREDNGLESDDEDDDLLLRLAQDRDALLKACKVMIRVLDENSFCFQAPHAYEPMVAAIAQAERP